MPGDRWSEISVPLKANTVKTINTDFGEPVNTVIVKNLNSYPIYAGLKPTLTTSDYEIIIQPNDYGMIVRPYNFTQVYLLTTVDMTITVYFVWTQNPIVLLPNMTKPIEATNVVVTQTAGLKAGELDLDASKRLGVNVNALPALPAGTNNIGKVDVNALPALPAGTNNIGKVDINALPDVRPAGWTWAKINAAAAGDVTVKATPGKVAWLLNDSAATIMLKDGTVQAWKAGDIITYGCPINCLTSIVVNFSAAGTAWILYS